MNNPVHFLDRIEETKMATMIAKDKSTAKTGWDTRHNKVVRYVLGMCPLVVPSTHEMVIAQMLRAWHEYARAHKEKFESPIGEDYVLGPEWKAIGEGIRGLLNGETGRLDCGTLDAFILDTLDENGIDTANL